MCASFAVGWVDALAVKDGRRQASSWADGGLLTTAGRLEQSAQFVAREDVDYDRVALHMPRVGIGNGVLNASESAVA